MKYCTECGAEINNQKICSNCEAKLKFTPKYLNNSKRKTTNKKILTIVLAIIVSMLLVLVFSLHNQSKIKFEPTIDYAMELLGIPCEKVLSNDAFSVSSFLDINIARAKTENVFGIAGEYVIFIFDDQEYIDIVTWQSKEDIKHTDTEIESLVNGMIDIYGNPTNSSDGSYLWHNEKFSMMLDTEDEAISIVITSGE